MRKIANIVGALGLAVLALIGVRDAVQIARSGVACSVPNTFSNGTTADATQVNANFSALVACFANSASAGANSDITSLTGLTTPLSAALGGTQYFWGGTGAGTANAQTVTTVTPASGFSLTNGVGVCFIPGATNTGSATLAVNGTAATAFRRLIQINTGLSVQGVLTGGELLSGSSVTCAVYSGVAWIITSQGVYYPGEVKDFAYAGCPTGWLEANAGSFNTTNFPDLNTAIGTTWGVAGTLPDLRGRATFGRDSGGSGRITTDQNGALAGQTVGSMGGQQNQTLTANQVPLLTVGANITMALNSTGILQYAGGGAFSGSTEFTISGSGTRAPAATSPGTFNQIAPNSTLAAASNINNTGSQGQSHPVTPPLGIVTKCVKL